MRGGSILKLIQFGDHLSQFSLSPGLQQYARPDGTHSSQSQTRRQSNDLNYWQNFADHFFSPSGVLRQQVWDSGNGELKQFEISTPLLPRYYWIHFSSGVQNMQMILENAREKDLPNGGHFVESVKSTFIYWFVNGCQVMIPLLSITLTLLTSEQLVTSGNLRAQFDQSGKIDVLDLITSEHNEYIPRAQLLAPVESPDPKQSPKTSKTVGKQRSQQKHQQPQPPQITLPVSIVNSYGVTQEVMRFLEVYPHGSLALVSF